MDGPSPLTGRERELLTLALDGSRGRRHRRARVHLSEGTVRNHLSAAIGKTGATTRARRRGSRRSAAGSDVLRESSSRRSSTWVVFERWLFMTRPSTSARTPR